MSFLETTTNFYKFTAENGESSRSSGLGQADAMEGVQVRSQEIVRVKDLSHAQRNLILNHRPEIYKIDGEDLDAICDIRGLDVPSHFASSRMKYACVVATSKDMRTKRTFIGPSIDLQKRGANDDTSGETLQPANINKISVRFHFETQTPNFEISTRVHGTHKHLSDDMATTRIYAQDLLMRDGRISIFAIAPGQPEDPRSQRFERKSARPGNANVEELKSILEDARLYEVMLVFKPGVKRERHWTGIPNEVVKKIQDNIMGSTNGTAETLTRDLLVHQLGREDTNLVSFYVMLKPENVPVFEKQVEYMINLFTVAQGSNFGRKLRWDFAQLPHEPRASKEALIERLDEYEYNLGLYYLGNEVKAPFCTNSSAAHELLTRAFKPDLLIMDEASLAGLGDLATPVGVFKGSLKHITLAGDHKQGKPIFAAADSNIGHSMLSRSLFAEIAEDKSGEHKFTALETSYRCVKDLLDFPKRFYPKLNANASCGRIEPRLVKTLKSFWATYLRTSFKGKPSQVAFDIRGRFTQMKGSTTKTNHSEAKAMACTIKLMLDFTAPPGGRQIIPADIAVIVAYTGMALAIEKELTKLLGFTTSRTITVSTINHARGSEWNIVLFACVIALGVDRVQTDQRYPIGFVANPASINVVLSRVRVGRYIFGNLNEMVQMVLDRHPAAANQKYKPFFDHLKGLSDNDQIVTEQEWVHVLTNGAAPAPDAYFAQPYQFKKGLITA